MGCRALCLVLLGLLAESTYGQSCTLITSNVLRMDSEETFIVDGHGAALDGDIIIQDFPKKKFIIAQGKISVNSGIGFLGTSKFLVPSTNLDKDPEKKQFVYVTLSSACCNLEKVLLVSYQSGYIFIQTDKPLYTPGSTVLYRIFSTTPDMKPSNKPVVVEVLTPDHVIMQKNIFYNINMKGIISKHYRLTDLASSGTWSIVATFEDSPLHKFTTQFEVKEYVLPSFEVKIKTDKNFFYISDQEFHVEIKAKYLNGKPLEGMAYVLFSVSMDSERKGLPDTLQRIQIEDGEGSAVLKREDLVKYFQWERDMLQWRLSVSATVITDSGSDMVKAELPNIPIVASPYKVLYVKTSKYFKPGMPMDVTVSVTNPDGSPAHHVPVVAEPGRVRGITLRDGTARLPINTRADITSLTVTVRTEDSILQPDQQASASMEATLYQPRGGNFLHLSICAGELKVGENVAINFVIRNTDPAVQNQTTHFNYIVLSKGRIIRVGRQERTAGQVLGTLKLLITPEFLPSFRMVAYYVVSTEGGREIVADSVWADVADTCMETLTLSGDKRRDNAVQQPGALLRLRLKADHMASVGLVAVDKGVYMMNSKQKISQTKVWDSVEKYDTGCTAGGGADASGVFYDAGLALSNAFHGSTPQRTEFLCAEQLNRRKRDAELIKKKNNEDFVHETDITSRSEFPKSWLWTVVTMTEKPENGISSKTLNIFLNDSLTTWEVLAVSLSEAKGICVSEPHDIQVTLPIFIDLQLPYSVVRNEQVEIRAILYNNGHSKQRVRLEWTYNEHFCSLATSNSSYSQYVDVKPQSSVAALFLIIPITLGYHDVEVKASGQGFSDGVKKKLKVVPGGKRTTQILRTVILHPENKGKDGVQEELIKAIDAKNIVPNTDVTTVVTVQGTPITQVVEELIDGANLNALIGVPYGSGEDNMLSLSSTVIAAHYLDATGQWEKIGVQRRAVALQYISKGVTGQLSFRKPDASYGVGHLAPKSTWLTAYVVKVFALAQSFVNVDRNVMCDSVKWLILDNQKTDGSFVENGHVYNRELAGGMKRGAVELDSTLTAFVLIAMLESEHICTGHINNLRNGIDRAIGYIEQQYPVITRPYSIGITSYALAKAGRLPNIDKLMSASTDNNRWEEPNSRELSREASSYALLALLKMKEYDKAGVVVRWLTEQKFYGNRWRSTQSTVMLFQSMTEYYIDTPRHNELDMDVSLRFPGRSAPTRIRLNNQNALNMRSDQTDQLGDVMVTATGKGQGTLTAYAVYYAIEEEKQIPCKNFDLSLEVQEETFAKAPEGTLSTVGLTFCTKYLKPYDSTLSIVEISMMTGFEADVNDLKNLKRGVDRYISNFEINKGAADKSTVVLYIDRIPHTEEICLKFRLHQYFKIGLIQPASVTVYDYYSPENRCTKFYHLDENSKLLGKICIGDTCRCAEGKDNCLMQERLDNVKDVDRLSIACKPGLDYVYKTTLSEIKDQNNYLTYVMTIKAILKQGADVVNVNEKRDFVSHSKCRNALNLEVGQAYLVWGKSKDLWSRVAGYIYMVTRDTWIERWPDSRDCQKPQYLKQCDELLYFSEILELQGCPA